MSRETSELIGYVAAVLTTIAFFPQAWHTFRSRRAQGVSREMYALLCLGITLWLVYGIALGAWPVIIANGVTLVMALFILGMKVRYG